MMSAKMKAKAKASPQAQVLQPATPQPVLSEEEQKQARIDAMMSFTSVSALKRVNDTCKAGPMLCTAL